MRAGYGNLFYNMLHGLELYEFIYAPVGDNGAGVYTSAADAAKAFVASCKAGE